MSRHKSTNPFDRLFKLIEQAVGHLSNPRWKQALTWTQRLFLVAVVIYLIHRLGQIGWGEILVNLPDSPFFYMFSVALFSVPVFCEWQSYRIVTERNIPNAVGVFSRKRAYNEALLSMAGEVYLTSRLAALDGFNHRKALIAIKDNNIVSALVSNSWTLALVGMVAIAGRSDILLKIWELSPLVVGAFTVICLLVYILSFAFFRRLTSLNISVLVKIGSIHLAKVAIATSLLVLQWKSALPSEALQTWIIFVTVYLLLKRIPGLPNAELIFLGVGLSLAGFAQGTTQEVAAMLVAAAAMMQLVHFTVFLLTMRIPAASPKKAPAE